MKTITYVPLDPIEFTPPTMTSNPDYLMLYIPDNSDVIVSGVTIETKEGTKLVPFSPDGVRSVEWKESHLYIYFGQNLPTYTKGHLYLQKTKII